MNIIVLQALGPSQPPLTSQEWWTLGLGMLASLFAIIVIKNWVAYQKGYHDLPGWMRWPAAVIFRQDVSWPNLAAQQLMRHDAVMRQEHYQKLRAKREKKQAAQAVVDSARRARAADPPAIRHEILRADASRREHTQYNNRYDRFQPPIRAKEQPPVQATVAAIVAPPVAVSPSPAVQVLPAPDQDAAVVPSGIAVQQATWIRQVYEKVVHLIVVGETDAGKTSTLLPIIGTRIEHGDLLIVIDPHAIRNDWGSLKPYIVGWGRNFGEIEAWLQALLGEMNRRFKLEKGDPDTGPSITVIVDEVLSVNDNCPTWGEIIKNFTSEARKVNMRLIVVSQSDQVESLGLEGKGDLRKNLSFLRLGSKVKLARREGDIWVASLECPKLYGGAETLIDRTNLNQRPYTAANAEHLWFPKELPIVPPIRSTGSPRPWAARTLDDIRAGITVDFDTLVVEPLAGLNEFDNAVHALHSIYPGQKRQWYIDQLIKEHDIGKSAGPREKAYNEALRRIEHAANL